MDQTAESADRLEAFAELLHHHHRGLFSFVFSLVQHHADAEDVYQKVAIVLWQKFDEFTLGTNFAAWAAQVARYIAQDFLKSKRRRELRFSDSFLESIEAAYTSRETEFFTMQMEALEKCLEKLSPRDRELVELCYAPNRDMSHVASVTRRSLDAVYQAISRVRKNLARCVGRQLTA